MSYEWDNSGYSSNTITDSYGSLDKSYPKAFDSGSNINSYRQRDNWRIPSYESSYPLNTNSNFKVIDDSEFKRSDIPTYHTLPGRETHMMPFSHAMKRSAVTTENTAERYNEIFGDTRLYNSSAKKSHESETRKKPEGAQQYQPQGGPRMKILGDLQIDEVSANQDLALSGVDMDKRKVYNAIIQYFPNFELIKSVNYNGFGVYKAIVKCLLCTGVRYIVAIVKNDPYSIGTVRPLSVIKWDSFQTRFAEDDKDFRQFAYDSFNYEKPNETILDDRIKVVTRNKMSQVYQCDNLPLQVEILKMKEHEDLSDYGTVSSALELFQTVLTFTR